MKVKVGDTVMPAHGWYHAGREGTLLAMSGLLGWVCFGENSCETYCLEALDKVDRPGEALDKVERLLQVGDRVSVRGGCGDMAHIIAVDDDWAWLRWESGARNVWHLSRLKGA